MCYRALMISINFLMLVCLARCEDVETTSATSTSEAYPLSSSDPVIERSSHYHHDLHDHHHHEEHYKGFWKKKFVWRPRWVKTWQEKKIYVALWKRMWGPAEIKEWVPVPKPPPGWVKHGAAAFVVKAHPH